MVKRWRHISIMSEDTIFGICPVCGNDGGDAPATSLTGADSHSNIVEVGSGVILESYQGHLMCEVCKNRLQADDESIISTQKHAGSERFRQSAGFKREV
jgi:hypothetical protein